MLLINNTICNENLFIYFRMIHFITGQGNSETRVVPHKVRSTLSVNEARKVILQLSKPLADIADLINDNILALERHNKVLKTENQSIEELKENLYVPVVNLRFKEVTEPITVCTAAKCSEIYTVSYYFRLIIYIWLLLFKKSQNEF